MLISETYHMFKCVEVFFPFLTECVTDQFIEALTNPSAKNQKKMEWHDDAGQKGKKSLKAS